eukprot:3282677-Amphidinium_carterae.1
MQDQVALGGMRNPTGAVAQIPRMQQAGRMIHDVLARALRESPTQATAILSALDGDGDGPDEEFLEQLRLRILGLQLDCVEPTLGDYSTVLRGRLMHGLAVFMGEPDTEAVEWLYDGTPMGRAIPIPPSGLYPAAAQPDMDVEERCGGEDMPNIWPQLPNG